MATTDLYAVLGVPADASAEDIRKAYRKLALQFHPDKNGAGDAAAAAAFLAVAEAYETLSNEAARAAYDASRRPRQRSSTTSRGGGYPAAPPAYTQAHGGSGYSRRGPTDPFTLFEAMFGAPFGNGSAFTAPDPFSHLGHHTSASYAAHGGFDTRGHHGGGGWQGASVSTSTSSTYVNGVWSQTTVTETRHADGRVTRHESHSSGGQPPGRAAAARREIGGGGGGLSLFF